MVYNNTFVYFGKFKFLEFTTFSCKDKKSVV